MARPDATSDLSEWVEQVCDGCGLLYPQRQSYERKCPVCFKLDKGYDLLWGDLSFLWSQQKIVALQAEVAKKETALLESSKRLKTAEDAVHRQALLAPAVIPVQDLLRLCHPDRHNGSTLATEVTKKLLAMRKK